MTSKLNKAKPVNWELTAKKEGEKRKRLARALLALRDVKAPTSEVEPIFRRTRVLLLGLIETLPADLEMEAVDDIRRMVTIEVWRILETMGAQVLANEDPTLTPVFARYVEADRALRPGDLDLK